MLIVQSDQQDPRYNLALEEALLDRVADEGYILYFYVNNNSVVIGKNQNPWRECQLPLMEDEDCLLARRITGGGAVYHDPGNLNFSFMMPRTAYKEARQYEIVLAALRKLGVVAHLEGRNSLFHGDRKFSGNAFCFRKHAALHHGTVLLHADLNRLGRYLNGSSSAIETKAIASIPAKVLNLSEVNAAINREDVIELISDEAARTFDRVARPVAASSLGLDLSSSVQEHASWAWLYGRTPPFVWRGKLEGKDVVVDVERGVVSRVDNVDEDRRRALVGQRWSDVVQ